MPEALKNFRRKGGSVETVGKTLERMSRMEADESQKRRREVIDEAKNKGRKIQCSDGMSAYFISDKFLRRIESDCI